MCTATHQRYWPQPVRQCTAFQEKASIQLQLHLSDGSVWKRRLILMTDHPFIIEMLSKESWLVSIEQDKLAHSGEIPFQRRKASAEAQGFEISDYFKAGGVAPEDNLSLRSFDEIVWSKHPCRGNIIGWFDHQSEHESYVKGDDLAHPIHITAISFI